MSFRVKRYTYDIARLRAFLIAYAGYWRLPGGDETPSSLGLLDDASDAPWHSDEATFYWNFVRDLGFGVNYFKTDGEESSNTPFRLTVYGQRFLDETKRWCLKRWCLEPPFLWRYRMRHSLSHAPGLSFQHVVAASSAVAGLV